MRRAAADIGAAGTGAIGCAVFAAHAVAESGSSRRSRNVSSCA
jgi:hypothetical protein